MERKYAEYLLKKTKEDYNLIAEDFSSKREVAWEEFNFLKDWMFAGEKFLDLGCGNGRFIELFKEQNIEYFGVDNSERLIKIAKERYPQETFQTVDALNLPFPDNFFDKVLCVAVLHHIPSDEYRIRFLSEAKRVLKPGGALILTVWHLWQKKSAWGFLLRNIFLKLAGKSKLDFFDVFVPWKNSQGEIRAQRYFHCFTRKELQKLAENVGLKIRKVNLFPMSGGHSNLLLIAEKRKFP